MSRSKIRDENFSRNRRPALIAAIAELPRDERDKTSRFVDRPLSRVSEI